MYFNITECFVVLYFNVTLTAQCFSASGHVPINGTRTMRRSCETCQNKQASSQRKIDAAKEIRIRLQIDVFARHANGGEDLSDWKK